ncbi:hypothetical protein BD410DRAFT_774718 [Rickenella mellea]|uniref:GPI transamidase component PIG-S n=1 Tax=Rickenella mellea TaxID=50990 RepID=A0A4Y7PUH8_9AGAM|nr:hypothetical protein BD410DRAFT_774718 [Rickenella mellea]
MDAAQVDSDEVVIKDVAFQSESIRRRVLTSYWIVVLLALPLWWYSTSIQRLSLPNSRVHAQESKQLVFSADIGVTVEGLNFDAQQLVRNVGDNLKDVIRSRELGYVFDVKLYVPSSSRHDYTVTIKNSTDSYVLANHLSFGAASHSPSEVPFKLANTLGDLLTSSLASKRHHDEEHRVMQYAPRYRLAFSLLNEDATAGNTAFGWEIQEAINRSLSPSLKQLSALHNFTIESHVQFHAPLAFTPKNLVVGDSTIPLHGLTQEQLTVFINSADWVVSSGVSNDPVLHFVLYVPSASRRPLRILDTEGNPTASSAFIVPQWGGVVIYNPPVTTSTENFHLDVSMLRNPFSIFQTQLLALLGVPQLPSGINTAPRNADNNNGETGTGRTSWQLDALLRARALEATKGSTETMTSIVKLVKQIDGMPVGKDVLDDVRGALDALDEVYTSALHSPRLALSHARDAAVRASRAFFNPGMLALLYFPAEHTLAVYTPLFAPVGVPLIAAALREMRDWRARKQAARTA